ILAVSGVVHEFYVDGLRKKVDRGQIDAFRRGKNLRPPAFGYCLVPVESPDGQPLLNQKRRPLMKVVIDEAEAAIVREVFQRYVERGQSLREITLWLNEIEAGGST